MALLASGTEHRYQLCRDEYCERPWCRIYKEGVADGYGAGYSAGYDAGHASGYDAGYSDGAAGGR